MPTGFTAPIYDGEDITFEQFANSCLRNFGIYLRFEGKYPNLSRFEIPDKVSKQWFDMIADGRKEEEYREIKPYWVARLFHNNSNIVDVRNLASALAGRTDLLKKYIDAQRIVLKQYTHVLFINGYRKDSPRIEKEIKSISIGKLKKGLCPDKWLDTEFFIIKFK